MAATSTAAFHHPPAISPPPPRRCLHPNQVSLSLHPSLPRKSLTLNLPPLKCSPLHRPSQFRVFASSSAPPFPQSPTSPPNPNPLLDSTRTVSFILAAALSFSRRLLDALKSSVSRFTSAISTPSAEELAALHHLQDNLVCAIGPLFFAAVRDPPSGYLNTPLTVVASGLAKWLDIYSGVLMVRVLLSWFPNIPWDRQPLSAIRDLCDPYLNLFRNIIPPVFDTLDVSPLLAFAVLGTLGSILSSSRGI
ncbi:YlmG-like protein 1-2 [Nymphaea thermarum]|nr:YlmG-like protein 1-2 [Nymphaea thermarum]